MPTRQKLLESLTRFELTTEQVTGVANEDQRPKRGIAARPDKIVQNPYLLFEQDKGDDDSEPIGLETIDQGMWPEGDAALFRSDEAVTHNDERRVRAIACAVLREAADSGDTLLPFETFMRRLHDRFSDKRRCLADREAFWSGQERTFHSGILWLKEQNYPDSWCIDSADAVPSSSSPSPDDELFEDLGADAPSDYDTPPTIKLVALKSVRRQEVEVARIFDGVRKIDDLPSAMPNWRALLTVPPDEGGFGKPQSQREIDAIDEKEK